MCVYGYVCSLSPNMNLICWSGLLLWHVFRYQFAVTLTLILLLWVPRRRSPWYAFFLAVLWSYACVYHWIVLSGKSNHGCTSYLPSKASIQWGAECDCYRFSSTPLPPSVAFGQVQDATLNKFLFIIKAKMLDGALQNDAVEAAFQVPPTSLESRDGMMFCVCSQAFGGCRHSLQNNEKLYDYIEEASVFIPKEKYCAMAVNNIMLGAGGSICPRVEPCNEPAKAAERPWLSIARSGAIGCQLCWDPDALCSWCQASRWQIAAWIILIDPGSLQQPRLRRILTINPAAKMLPCCCCCCCWWSWVTW